MIPRRIFRSAAALTAFTTMTAAALPDAHAQYSGNGSELVPIFITAMVIEGGTGIGGVVSGIGSAVHVGKGTVNNGWFASSYVFGGLNLAAAFLWGALADGDPGSTGYAALATAHGSVALIDLALPTIGYLRGPRHSRAHLRPVVVGGLDVGGQRWAGGGVELVGF